MKPKKKKFVEEVATVSCRLCNKTFVSEVAITNHVRTLHIDAYASGNKEVWMEHIVIKSKEDIKKEQELLVQENTESLLASMGPTSLTSLASEDVSYIVVKDEDGQTFVRKRKRNRVKPVKPKLVVEKKQRTIQSITGPFECLQPSSVVADGLCHQIFFSCCEYSKHFCDEHARKKKGHKCQVCEKILDPSTEVSKFPYNCQVCAAGFETKKELSSHIDTVHSSLKPFECNICSKRFTQQGGLQQHLRMHTGERPYSCTFCTKTFTQKSGLDQHLRIHTNVKPYRCIVCSKTFAQLTNMKQHMRNHTNVSPFECGLCHKKFKQSNNLNNHLRAHSSNMNGVQREKFKKLIDVFDQQTETGVDEMPSPLEIEVDPTVIYLSDQCDNEQSVVVEEINDGDDDTWMVEVVES